MRVVAALLGLMVVMSCSSPERSPRWQSRRATLQTPAKPIPSSPAGVHEAEPASGIETQLEMNTSAGHELASARDGLSRQYRAVVDAVAADRDQAGRVIAAQAAWESYVRAQLSALYGCEEPGVYGSVMPLCAARAEMALVEVRTRELQAMLDAEEGDVCNWVYPCSGDE